MIVKVLAAAALLAAPVAASAPIALNAVDPRTINDSMPPVRFMGSASTTVSFGTLSECGVPIPGFVFEGCVRDHVIHMPNPCSYGYREEYAKIMCHELAHVNGWPATHGD